MKRRRLVNITSYCVVGALSLGIMSSLSGCGVDISDLAPVTQEDSPNPHDFSTSDSATASSIPEESTSKGSRDNTPVCLEPLADGGCVFTNDVAYIDASHVEDGYFCAKYTGDSNDVLMLVTPEGEGAYTYKLEGHEYETFPLTSGSRNYTVAIYTLISGTQYATCLSQVIPVNITNEFGPFLYPNQYVKFNANSKVVSKASDLVAPANSDLEAVTSIYNYVVSNISYDYAKAENIPGCYTSDVDSTLESGSGICIDYSAVMCSMLRSQGIPSHLEIGYAGEAYHAWISVFITDIGWINGMIEFDGNSWSLMDPTFASNSSESALKKFIGSGDKYQVKFVY